MNPIKYYTVGSSNMSDTETESKDEGENNNEVLSQIGEDPGLPADTIEQDSKARTSKEQKQRKSTDLKE